MALYAFYLIEYSGQGEVIQYNKGLELILVLSCFYFLLLEFIQFMVDWREYLCNYWNLIELFPNVLLLMTLFCYNDRTENHERVMYFRLNAFISLLLWFKLACSLRYFSMGSYLILSLVQVF